MSKYLLVICVLQCLWCGKLLAQQTYSDEVINGFMPFVKGDIKQEFRFVNSLGLTKYSEKELAKAQQTSRQVVAILLDWLNKNPPQGFEAKINVFFETLSDPAFGSPFDDPHPKIYVVIEVHFAPYVHTPQGKFANYAASTWLTVFLNGTGKFTAGIPVAEDIYELPHKTADFFGADIYQTTQEEITLVGQNNTPVFLPISQEVFLRACIKGHREDKRNAGIVSQPSKEERLKEIEIAYNDILEVDKKSAEEFKKKALEELATENYENQLDLESQLQKELDGMAATERQKPAFYAGEGDASSEMFDLTGNFSGLCPEKQQNRCRALVRLNPVLKGFSAEGKIKLLIIRWQHISRFFNEKEGYDNAHRWNIWHLYQDKEVWEHIFDLVNY